jgi:hypothetical protein
MSAQRLPGQQRQPVDSVHPTQKEILSEAGKAVDSNSLPFAETIFLKKIQEIVCRPHRVILA